MDTLPPPTLPPVSLEEAKKQIRISHLEQLSHANLTLSLPVVDDESTALPRCENLKDRLIEWSKDHIDSIQKAIANGTLSGKEAVNWDYCFLAFLESMTVYLRKWDKLYQAVKTFKDVKAGNLSDSDMHTVHDLYEESQSDIKEIAAIWGMDFMQICDLTKSKNDKNPAWNGPFCGAFFPKDNKQGACVGIAFKGTDPKNPQDIHVDESFEPIQAESSLLFGTIVSEGVYNAMFGTFNDGDPLTPFQRVLGALQKLVPTLQCEGNNDTTFHVTGHSLGGSYSSFCFAQCMMQNAGDGLPAGTQLGDLYNFGSPRVGQQAWSEAFYSNLSGNFPGGAWRIVNDKDIVPQVPSLLRFKPGTGPFYHIDNGIKIFKTAKPTPIPSEREGPGNKDIGLTRLEFMAKLGLEPYHFPLSYYNSMAYALANR